MRTPERLKIVLVGAGSVTFCPPTLIDTYLNDRLNEIPLEICLMDISEHAVKLSERFAKDAAVALNRTPKIWSTTELEVALNGADFVITAIEVDRYHFWAQDFHIPRKYGFRQLYGENGGPGGMFHTLRNFEPMLKIAQTMERICPDAWLINYTNPEAKIVEAIAKLTEIKVVGLCHGALMGVEQVARFLQMPESDLDFKVCGLNHFGWFQKIASKRTGEDLYPILKEKERLAHWMSGWDEIGLSRILLRTFGLYPYPGTNHIGEYLGWSDEFLASSKLQYFYDPVAERPWQDRKTPQFVYSLSQNPTEIPLFPTQGEGTDEGSPEQRFDVNNVKFKRSGEVGVPIIEAIAFDIKTDLPAVNMQNHGTIPDLPDDMVVEFSAYADGHGIHPVKMERLPTSITEMIRVQGAIHQLLIEAFVEKSKNKLLQAVLLDPTVSTYNNAVAMIDEMCDLQKNHLPEMHW